MAQPISPDNLLACHQCDLLHCRIMLKAGEAAHCFRCNAYLYANKPGGTERALALSLAAVILFVLSNIFPFLILEVKGITQTITLISGIIELFRNGMWALASFSLGLILLFPLVRLFCLIYVLSALKFQWRIPGFEHAYRLIHWLSPWSMMEIYLLGALIALVKVASLASIHPGPSFWTFVLLIVIEIWALNAMDLQSLWDSLEKSQPESICS